jgi:oxygen-independent coproporphyrinogen-3 oxidase
MRGRIIEQLLCQGRATLPPLLETEVAETLRPFIMRNLATLEQGHLSIAPDGLPYVRTIAALFDPYREQSLQRFSSAV